MLEMTRSIVSQWLSPSPLTNNVTGTAVGTLRDDSWGVDKDGKVNYLESVSPEQAIRLSAVYACVRAIAGPIGRTKIRIVPEADRRNLLRLLNVQPNPLWSAVQFWEWVTWQVLLDPIGSAIVFIERDINGRPLGLYPLKNSDVRITVGRGGETSVNSANAGGRLNYHLIRANRDVDQDNILHFTGLEFDGVKSRSVIASGAFNEICLGHNVDNYVARFFKKGAQQRYAVVYEKGLHDDSIKKATGQVKKHYEKGQESGEFMFFGQSAKLYPLQVSPQDADTRAFRNATVSGIARAFGLNPRRVGSDGQVGVNASGLTEENQDFEQNTLGPYFIRFANEIDRKLLYYSGGQAVHDSAWLLRGTPMQRAQRHRIELSGRAYRSVNDVREEEGLARIDEDWADEVPQGSTAMPVGDIREDGMDPGTGPIEGGSGQERTGVTSNLTTFMQEIQQLQRLESRLNGATNGAAKPAAELVA